MKKDRLLTRQEREVAFRDRYPEDKLELQVDLEAQDAKSLRSVVEWKDSSCPQKKVCNLLCLFCERCRDALYQALRRGQLPGDAE